MQSIRLSYYVELILKCILFDGFLTNNVTNTDKILPYINVNVLIVQGPFAFLEQSLWNLTWLIKENHIYN